MRKKVGSGDWERGYDLIGTWELPSRKAFVPQHFIYNTRHSFAGGGGEGGGGWTFGHETIFRHKSMLFLVYDSV